MGVIKEGSVHVKTHKLNLLSPITIAKLGSGKILGHECDDGLTSGCEQWVINYTEGTEIIHFEKEVFDEMWRIQNMNPKKATIMKMC